MSALTQSMAGVGKKSLFRAAYIFPVALLVLLALLFLRSLLDSPSGSVFFNLSFGIAFLICIGVLIYADYRFDIYRQRRKLLRNYAHPPDTARIPEAVNRLNHIQTDEIQILLSKTVQAAQSILQRDIQAAILFPDSMSQITSHPSLHYPPSAHDTAMLDIGRHCAEQSLAAGFPQSTCLASDSPGNLHWSLSIPVKASQHKAFMALVLSGRDPAPDPTQQQRIIRTTAKYALLIGTLFLELARVKVEVQ